FQDFRGLAIVTGIVGILSLPFYVGGAYWFGVFGSVIAAILCIIFNIVINSLFIYKNTKKYGIHYEFSKGYKELSVLWNSNLPMVICGILYVGMQWLLQMMLRIQPNGATELGEFYAAQNIQIAFFFLPVLLSTVFFPNLCEIGGTSQNSRYWSVVKKGLGLQAVISLVIALPMILFPNFLMKLNGNEFIDSGLILVTFSIWGLLNILCGGVWQVMIDQKKVWSVAIFEVGEIIISLTLGYFLLEQQWGNIGIVTSFIVGRIVILILMIFYLRRHA
ncbi:MAG: hypothetical protein LBE13_05955, partial [Bacteroidales bacterium]|nr:hypothetical protein [Bacteroidales bacterium]